MLAARHGWRWLSAGQLLRDTHDIELIREMQAGGLVEHDKVNQLIAQALEKAKSVKRVVLDGYPRALEQAQWLVDSRPQHEYEIELVVILEVPRGELMKRLEIRGRADDTPEAIDERLNIYRQEIYPILTYLTEKKIRVVHIDGVGTVGEVHDRIQAELEACNLV